MRQVVVAAAIAALLAAAGGYWAGQHGAASNASAPDGPAQTPRKILYYRNPMGLPDTSPTPKKDPMGMDYLPVYEGEPPPAAGEALVRIDPQKVQTLGVRVEAVRRQPLERQLRAAGRVEPDERRVFTIAPKFEGYVERLHVNATGQAVAKGQPLAEVYSPELLSAQREYAIAAQGLEALQGAGEDTQRGMRELAQSSLARLRNWDISDEQLKALAQSGTARRTLSFRSPVAGIVTEKKAVQGMRFLPGEPLYQVTDLGSVWVIAELAEQDIGLVRAGAKATVRLPAYPDRSFSGTVGYVYPTLTAATRTVPVRIELANPGGLLKPGMFAEVALPAASGGAVLTVPTSAVIDSGRRQLVLVQQGEGRFAPRAVRVGARSEDRVEIVEGVQDGEQVVVAANFLIDAESNLKAALGSLGPAGAGAQGTDAATQPAAAVGHRAEGTVEELDAGTGTLTLAHGPVPSLKWPAMSMEFKLAHGGLLGGLKPGTAVVFEFVERGPGEWVITSIKPSGPAPAASHAGHN